MNHVALNASPQSSMHFGLGQLLSVGPVITNREAGDFAVVESISRNIGSVSELKVH